MSDYCIIKTETSEGDYFVGSSSKNWNKDREGMRMIPCFEIFGNSTYHAPLMKVNKNALHSLGDPNFVPNSHACVTKNKFLYI